MLPYFEPSTPEQHKIIGCLVGLAYLFLLGLALFICIKTGFRESSAVKVLLFAVVLGGAAGFAW